MANNKQKKMVPELRFKGFHDDWVQRKLEDIGTTYSSLSGKDKTDFGHGDARYVTYMNVFSNPIADPKQVEAIEVDKKQTEVRKYDFFFTTSSETPEEVGMSSLWLGQASDTYLNSFCFGYRLNHPHDFDEVFLAEYFRAPGFRLKMQLLAQGISRYNISKNRVMRIAILVPSKQEQQQIGLLLRKLDRTIALQQEKLNLLKQLKRGYLQKLFPVGSAKQPEFRFAGFDGDWVQHQLGQISDSYSGGTPSVGRVDYYHGQIPFIRSAELSSAEPELTITNLGLQNSSARMVKKGTLLYAMYGATSGEVGIAAVDGAINQAILAIIPKQDYETRFIQQWLLRSKKTITVTYLQGGQGNLSAQIIKKLKLQLPSTDEQNTITNFLGLLDRCVVLQQHKLDALTQLKQAYLQKLFV